MSKYENQILEKNYQILLEFKGVIYRGYLVGQNRTSLSLNNIEKKLGFRKVVTNVSRFCKNYMFPKSS